MALPGKSSSSYSPMMILLLVGLSALAWISTYSGMLQLIAASSGDIGLPFKVAIAFAVFMLQGMILFMLDALFSGQLRLILYPFYITGYLILVLISVAFAFGFYWRFLEAGAQTTAAAGASVFEVQKELQTSESRLEQLQSTFATLSTISTEKAEKERSQGGTCPRSRPGDGPRRRLRDADAQRFQFANDLIGSRVNAVKTDIADLNNDLQRVIKKDPATIDPATGTRTAFIEGLDRKLGLIVTRFNALRTDPQLRQVRDEFAARASQTSFPDERGGQFICPDGELQLALNGAVRSLDNLPELQKPELRSVEGSEAVIEAFRRLSNTGISLVTRGTLPPSPEKIRAEQGQLDGNKAVAASFTEDQAGLSDRDYIPLMIAIFVDVCILLVSINRPFGPFFNLGRDLTNARARGPMQGVLETFYQVFQRELGSGGRSSLRGAQEGPTAGQLIAPLQDVVFDHKGDYYAAVPLDFREDNYLEWASSRSKAPTFESSRALETSRYLAAIFAILEGEHLVVLQPEDKLKADEIRSKLDKQGSMYAQADAFRVYRFKRGAWADLLIQTVGSSAAREDALRRQTGGRQRFGGFLGARRGPGERREVFLGSARGTADLPRQFLSNRSRPSRGAEHEETEPLETEFSAQEESPAEPGGGRG